MTTMTRNLTANTWGLSPALAAPGSMTLVPLAPNWHTMNRTPSASTAVPDAAPMPRPDAGVQVVTRTFANFAPIAPLTTSPTTEYRAEIAVGGLAGGAITAATVHLPGLARAFPQGVDLLLMGPAGHDVLLFATGDQQADSVGFDLTFIDPPASTPLDADARGDAPGRPASSPVPSGPTSLAVLTSTAPNGIWQLCLFADIATPHVFFGGCTLTITAQLPA